ncbi:MAG: 3'-5' exonuclease domain-containing protein 2, partial [bacterium]|nr:3'-5' exonuclease domain-containing protein 2 [bacterium]
MELLMANRLTREYINSLPIIRFEGEVVVVTSESQAEESLDRLMGESCVGFDTESRPSFTRGTSYPISVLQFSTDDTAYLFQLKKTGFPDKLVTFLEDKDIKKIGVGIKNDIEKLQELREFTAGGFVDLSKIASDKGIIQVGLRGLAARYTSHRITKTAQKTNWAHPQLTWKQQIYAASDAWICLLIYPRLLEDGTNYRQFIEEEEKKTEAKKTKTKKSETKKIESKKNESKKTESKKT